jgi:hypothetical protein
VKGKVKIETVYPTITGQYFQSPMNNNDRHIDEFPHRLAGYEFEDNDDIVNKIIMTRSDNKTIRAHKQNDIDYLNDLLFGMNLIKKDSKIITECI